MSWIELEHANAEGTIYAHLDQVTVALGQAVDQAAQLGTVGNTGNSFGAHLHFEERSGKVGVMSSAGKKGSAAPKSTAEWIALSVSLIILSGFVAAILWLWNNQPTGPPQFKVERGVVRNETGLFHLPVTVTNTGGLAVG